MSPKNSRMDEDDEPLPHEAVGEEGPAEELDEEPLSLDEQIQDLKKDQQQLVALEQDYADAKERVAELWKRYWPAAERKKELSAQLKARRAAVRAKLDKHKELKALVNSLGS